MGEIIIPGTERSDRTPYAHLSPPETKQVMSRMTKILRESFETDERRLGKGFRERVQTQAEMKRRANILGKWFRVLKGDMGYTAKHALDVLPFALRTELDGGHYVPPPKHRLWTPGGVLS